MSTAQLKSFLQCLQTEITNDSHILVGFSGGADSTALLHMLYDFRTMHQSFCQLTAIHVHHGIRGAEADRDAAFCRDFCAKYDIPFTLVYTDVPALAKKNKISIEEAARDARYAQFAAYLSAHPKITHMCTAHHADDQTETILFRMLRGTSTKGLCGIPQKRLFPVGTHSVVLLRPLLAMTHDALIAYCQERQLAFVTDSTNFSLDASRNLLRNQILPAACSINPSFPAALQRLAAASSVDEDYFQTETEKLLKNLPPDQPYPLHMLTALHPACSSRLLSALYVRHLGAPFADYPLSQRQIESMQKLLFSVKPSSIQLPHSLLFSVFPAGDSFAFEQSAEKRGSPTDYTIPVYTGKPCKTSCGSAFFLDNGTAQAAEILQDLKNIYKFFISTTINSDTICGSLFIRNRRSRAEDRYICGGHTKLVKDALSSHKVSPKYRGSIPLFCDEAGILWVPFCGIRDSVNPNYAILPHCSDIYYFYDE